MRMSTEHQTYSIANQEAAIAAYAVAHGQEIVRTYVDAGISGLTLKRRDALKQLLRDVLEADTGYDVILVYDVSRWGRFQDPDQSAHYEFLCKDAGVHVEYCAEEFANDGSLASTLLKGLKRAMAAEYSRELSVKFTAGRERGAAQGFWMGGRAGHGLRRRIVHHDGTLGPILEAGDRKAIQSDRLILIPGPTDEVEMVRRIFRMFAFEGLTYTAVARVLNREGRLAEGQAWTRQRVRQILTNENYIGTNVFGKHRQRLGEVGHRRAKADWIRVPDAFAAIVRPEVFALTSSNVKRHRVPPSRETMLQSLRDMIAAGVLPSTQTLRDTPGAYCPATYQRYFGSLMCAYELAGHTPSRKQRLAAARATGMTTRPNRYAQPDMPDDEMLRRLAELFLRDGRLTVQTINDASDLPSAHKYRERFGGMRRVYALVGFTPTGAQACALENKGGQTITVAEAAALAHQRALAAHLPAGPWSFD